MKRIMIMDGAGANHWMRLGLVNSIRLAGYQVYFWNNEGKSVHDAFVEFRPEICLFSTWQLNRAQLKCLAAHPETKVLLWADSWGPINKELDFNRYPVGVVTEDQKKLVEELLQVNKNVCGIITQHGEVSKEWSHGGWREMGLEIFSVPFGGDVTEYFPEPLNPAYACNIMYCGGYWPYKSKYIDEILMPLCYPNTNLSIKIFGNGFNTVNSLGNIDTEHVRKFYRNADITPAIYEPHAVEVYSDIPQRLHQTALSFGFQISQKAVGIEDQYEDFELVTADSKKDFHDKIVHFLNNPQEKLPFMQMGFIRALKSHTSLHRSIDLFRILGEDTTYLESTLSMVQDKFLGETL